MIRKLAIGLGAVIAVAAAALTPTAASAWGGHHGHRGHWGGYGIGLYAPTYIAAPDCYLVKRAYERRDGSLRVRYVTVCD